MRHLLSFLACLVIVVCGCNSGDAPAGKPFELTTKYWDGTLMRSDVVIWLRLEDIEQNGPELSGNYRLSGSTWPSLKGTFTGKIGSENAVVTMPLPEGHKMNFNEITLRMKLNQECSAEEAQQARAFISNQKNVPEEMLTRKLYKMGCNATWKHSGSDHVALGYLAESVKEDPIKKPK